MRRALRVVGVVFVLVLIGYLGISWKYAGGVTRVTRDRAPLKAAIANSATELWMVADCGHVKAFVTHPQEWQEHVLAFLERQLGP